jgi:hypothetical protein
VQIIKTIIKNISENFGFLYAEEVSDVIIVGFVVVAILVRDEVDVVKLEETAIVAVVSLTLVIVASELVVADKVAKLVVIVSVVVNDDIFELVVAFTTVAFTTVNGTVVVVTIDSRCIVVVLR